LPPNLVRVNRAARRSRQTQFTALLHHVDVASLRRAFGRLKRNVSAGVDGMTVTGYEQDLEANLQDLCERVHTGRYRPQPVRRVYIPKADGGRRPLGIPALEDKIVQSAIAEVLAAIYEVDFLDYSYGFRPGRSAHQALEALHTGLMTQRVNWVLDADIRSFFDSVDHEWMMRTLAVRVADRRVLRLIEQWLKAGVLESGEWSRTEAGTPQGAIISPLLANIFLHYALDIWAYLWRRRHARGPVVIVRYADDFVIGFQNRSEAEAMLVGLKERLSKFGLTLHEQKTRLIEFGKFAAERRARRGERRPETFDFLGFTHYCGETWDGRFIVKRKTQSKRMTRKLNELRAKARQRMHAPMAMQHRWLCSVLRGHYAYYGLPSNSRSMDRFWWEVRRLWYRALRRRDRRRSLTWGRFNQLLTERFQLPRPEITHP
jgi:group II intron reverse transcriptase/maturase